MCIFKYSKIHTIITAGQIFSLVSANQSANAFYLRLFVILVNTLLSVTNANTLLHFSFDNHFIISYSPAYSSLKSFRFASWSPRLNLRRAEGWQLLPLNNKLIKTENVASLQGKYIPGHPFLLNHVSLIHLLFFYKHIYNISTSPIKVKIEHNFV